MVAYRTSATISISLYTSIVALSPALLVASPFQAVSTWFSSYPHEEVLHKEYPLQAKTPYSVTVDQTLNGSVIVTGWDQNKLSLNGIKKVKHEGDMNTLAVSVDTTDNKITITTGHAKGRQKPRKACALDLEIFVPVQTALVIDSIEDVTVHDITNTVSIATEQGTVIANNIESKLTTHIETQGTTKLENIHGAIDAKTAYGDIIIADCHNSVFACTESGTIQVACARTPSRTTIDLKTHTGTIKLKIPEDTNATISGNTSMGKIVCTLPVTLKGHTTVLNRRTYKQMPKNLQGIIGEEGNAEIKLSSTRGIHIDAHRTT